MKLSGLQAWVRGWLVPHLIHRGGRNRMMRRETHWCCGRHSTLRRRGRTPPPSQPAARPRCSRRTSEASSAWETEKQKTESRAQKPLHHSSSSGLSQIRMQRSTHVSYSPVYTSFTCFCVGRSMFKLESIKAVYLQTRQIKPKHSNPAEWIHSKHVFYAHSLSVWKLLQQQQEEEGDRRKAGCVGGLSLSLITIGGNEPATFHRRWWRIAWRFPGQPLNLKAPWLTLNIKNPTWTHNNHVTVSYSPLHSPAVHELISGHQPEEHCDFFIKCPLKTCFIFYIILTRHL